MPKEFYSGDPNKTVELDHATQSKATDSVGTDNDKSLKLTDQEWEMAFNFFVF